VTQWIQVVIQKRLVTSVLAGARPVKPPLLLRLAGSIPLLRRIPAWLVGIGIRPEHVTTPAA
jgi:hypothetical protein